MSTKRDARTTPFVCDTRRSLWVYLALFHETGYRRGMEEHFLGKVLPESRADYAPTPEGLAAWLEANLPYVFSGRGERHASPRYGNTFEVDVDAKTLGTPNNERASLESWLRLASSADDSERDLGRRLLTRYVHESILPADWDSPEAWYAHWRDRIVFVDSAGFWWLENPTLPPR